MITIHNIRTESFHLPFDIRVDRVSVLGNPFHMKSEEDRDKVCNQYKLYFDKRLEEPKTTKFNQELNRLIQIYKQYKKLRLYCWCAPLRCHAETIRDYIYTLINICYPCPDTCGTDNPDICPILLKVQDR